MVRTNRPALTVLLTTSKSSRQIESFEGKVRPSLDDHFSPAIDPAHTSTILLRPTRETEVEIPPISKIGETGTFDDESYMGASSDRSSPPFSTSCVSGTHRVRYRN